MAKATYKEERQRLLELLKETEPTDDSYPKIQQRLKALEEADDIRKTRHLTADSVLKVSATVALTVGLVIVEQKVPLSSSLVKLLPRVLH